MTPVPPQLPRTSRFHMVDLFAGPGGLDVAADVLGIGSVGVENSPDACRTRAAAGLQGSEPSDVLAKEPADFRANVLAGGPPCQTFTVAGNGVGRRALDDVLEFAQRLVRREDASTLRADLARFDARTGLVLEPLRWALKAIDSPGLEPYEAIVLEQVPAVLPVWAAYADALGKEGYAVAHGILRAEEFGVPQTRRRAVLIARWDKDDIALPTPTHHPYRKGRERPSSDEERETWVSMEDVLPKTRPPFQVISNYGTGGNPKDRGRRRSCEPSATVTGKISRNRIVSDDAGQRELSRLDNSEAGLLQTFPAAYPWSGGDVAQQIGNAVPPRLAVHILSAALGLGTPGPEVWRALREWRPRSSEAPAPITGRAAELVGASH
ncbi:MULTISPECIES: DNA cytosine methyltransferase [Streptomyces]|uniref:DNA cytosine methyltransferase n=1 Tax=Streptomyces TaxID=1883 RepID=UPI001F42D1E3|nr:DNA cytosine methyltransferase [Streptomyces sp. NRRL F-5053]